jgi:2-polyprenyl-3-methyl-5-hydroxy-6-metoxy-1,4-benzoquinol methylase
MNRKRLSFAFFSSFSSQEHRQYASHHLQCSSSSTSAAFEKAQTAMTKLTTRKASWKRFRDMVDLALLNKTLNIQSAVDVGTDHGFLAVCLAATGSFGKGVLGVDVSEKALQTGAFRLEGKLQEYWRETNKNPLALSFKV